MKYVFTEPEDYSFTDINGHDGKKFDTGSSKTNHLIVECNSKLTVSLKQNECEFSYYVIEGEGYFVIEGEKQDVKSGNLIVIPPKTKFTFGGKLKMLLVNTPLHTPEQEEVIR